MNQTRSFYRRLFITLFTTAVLLLIFYGTKVVEYSFPDLLFKICLTGLVFIMVFHDDENISWEMKVILFGFLPLYLVSIVFFLLRIGFIDILITVHCLGIIVTYSLRFIAKPVKRRLDFLKWLWVTLAFSGRLLAQFEWPQAEAVSTIALIILPIMLVDFILFEPGIGFYAKRKIASVDHDENA